MNGFGEGLAFAALVAGVAWLEVSGKPTGGLWALIVVWVILSNWGQKKKNDDA